MVKLMRDVKGYEGRYSVNRDGKIYSHLRNKFFVDCNDASGYRIVTLRKDGKGKTEKVHRLAAIAYIPNPENKRCVNHKNGIKTDNRIENIEWVTDSENVLHAYKIGLNKRIFGNGHCNYKKINMKIARKIRGLKKSGIKSTEIAKKYDLSKSNVSFIITNKTWKEKINV